MTVLFHRRSAQTHLVADPVPQILAVLDDTPRSMTDIVQRLEAQWLRPGDDDAVRHLVEARLAELCALGLVARS